VLSSRMAAKTGFFLPRSVPKRANVANEAFGAVALRREGGMSWVSCRDAGTGGGPCLRDAFALPSSKINGLSTN